MSDKRSGSTLLENILSKSDQCFSVGELAMLEGHLTKNGPGEKWNWDCACGSPLTDCVFWSSIVKETYLKDPGNFSTGIDWNFKSKGLVLNAAFPSSSKDKLLKVINKNANQKVADTLNKLFSLVQQKSGKPFIVDSSKGPLQALAVYKKVTDFDVKIIWLKRDLRAIVTSKMKWKSLNKKKEKSMLKLLMDVFYFRRLCYTVFKMADPKDVLQMDYEALAKNPQKELQKIFDAFGLQPFPAPEYMELVEDHTIGGTPGRFTKKPIVYDDSWKEKYKNNRFAYFVGGILNKI
ncbi:hypothetical protein BH10BAC2_BH10BAC2_43930 [soil metagenome]